MSTQAQSWRPRRYNSLEQLAVERDQVAWYWRLIAVTASWMILGGYLIMPAAYDEDPKLRFSTGVLAILIVALLTAGYSFTGLLCFACRNWMFQAELVFLPALTSSAVGFLTVLWHLISSKRFIWNVSSIVGIVLSGVSTALYGLLLLWTKRKINRVRNSGYGRAANLWNHDTSYLTNYIQNMYPSARPSDPHGYATEDDLVQQHLAMLLMKSDPGPSPDAGQSTFHIDLPTGMDEEDIEQVKLLQQQRFQEANSRSLNAQQLALHQHQRAAALARAQVTSPTPIAQTRTTPTRSSPVMDEDAELNPDLLNPRVPRLANDYIRGRSASLTGAAASAETRGALDTRGRAGSRASPLSPPHARAVSREERRREIELGSTPSRS